MASTELPHNPPAHAGARGLNPQRHGNFAQWVAAIVASLALLLTLYFHHAEAAAKSDDEHIGAVADAKEQPKIDGINQHIDTLGDKITDLSSRVDKVEVQMSLLLNGQIKLKSEQGAIENRLSKEEAINRLQDPRRILATIRLEIQEAEARNGVLPPSELADYRAALGALPSSAADYWTTVAAVINYQSTLNQMSGEAPDPAKVSRTCTGLTSGTGGYNVYDGGLLSNCIIDLDTNSFNNVVFRNSVVRYQGGPVSLDNVAFINCSFVFALTAAPAAPPQEKLILAILNSPDQEAVRVQK